MSQIVLSHGGPRSVLLIGQAYEQEGLACPDIDERQAPIRLLYPRSFVDAASKMPGDKTHDYCFIGDLYRPETYQNRKWIIDFDMERFTNLFIVRGLEDEPALASSIEQGLPTGARQQLGHPSRM